MLLIPTVLIQVISYLIINLLIQFATNILGGRDILIEDVYIENYDDAVAVKPAKSTYVYSNCS
jgi:hypothetical protein